MNDLLAMYELMNDSVQDHPLLCLANVVTWLDPMWDTDNHEGLYPDDEFDDEGIGAGLLVVRDVFPDLYASAIDLIRSDCNKEQLDAHLIQGFNNYGFEIEELMFIGQGIPLPAWGIDLHEHDTHEMHAEIRSLVELFGIKFEEHEYGVEVPEHAYSAGRIICESLSAHDDPRLKQVGSMLSWVFSCSGNSQIDYTYEAISQWQPLSWDEENLDFALEIIQEAEAIMADVVPALNLIEATPILKKSLRKNINRLYKALAKTKGKKNAPHIRLEWPTLNPGTDGEAIDDSELLQLRRDAA